MAKATTTLKPDDKPTTDTTARTEPATPSDDFDAFVFRRDIITGGARAETGMSVRAFREIAPWYGTTTARTHHENGWIGPA
jgi:hypothetical protein